MNFRPGAGALKGTNFMQLALTIVQVVFSLVLVAVVMLQSGKSAGLFLSKNKAKSVDTKLARWTKWVAIAWVVLTLALCLMQ